MKSGMNHKWKNRSREERADSIRRGDKDDHFASRLSDGLPAHEGSEDNETLFCGAVDEELLERIRNDVLRELVLYVGR